MMKKIKNPHLRRGLLLGLGIGIVCWNWALYYAFEPRVFRDSASYLSVGEQLGSIWIDVFRTPVYPLYLKMLLQFFPPGLTFLHVCTALQWIVFLLSIPVFYRIVCRFTPKYSDWIAAGATLLYGLHPGILLWNRTILTEPFATSGVIFLAGLLTLGRRHSPGRIILAALLAAGLILLRPALIWIFFVLWICGLIRAFQTGRSGRWRMELAGCLLMTGILGAYMTAYRMQYGVFSLSSVSLLNQYINRRADAHPCGNTDPEIAADVNFFATSAIGPYFEKLQGFEFPQLDKQQLQRMNQKDCDLEFLFLTARYGQRRLRQFLWAEKRHDPGRSFAVWKNHCEENLRQDLFQVATFTRSRTMAQCAGFFLQWINFPMFWLLVFLPLQGGVLLLQTLHRKRLILYPLLLFLAECGTMLVILLGATGEWYRLLLPSLPLLLWGGVYTAVQGIALCRRRLS